MPSKQFTAAHVTHEAVEQIGGIGTVLEGLMISPVYKKQVKRSILIGPTQTFEGVDPETRLGHHGQVIYSSVDDIDRGDLADRFRPIEWAFDVDIVYGKRKYTPPGTTRKGEAEVLLINVHHYNMKRLGAFKLQLWEKLGLDSGKYEHEWDYEEYTRLAQPAYYALNALLEPKDRPCMLFSHEFMGMPTVFQAYIEAQKTGDHDKFRTIFHAHECATARRLVEDYPGHDTMFYNILDQAMAQGKYVEDIFEGLETNMRHALISRAYLCDGIIAVGDRTHDELKFLNPQMNAADIQIVYNGVPAGKVDLKKKKRSRKMLAKYSKELLGYEPDVLMTHVTRPVISKGLWRNLQVCHELDRMLSEQGKTGIMYLLTSAGGTRPADDIFRMEEEYDWPRNHREGYPDLVGPELELNRMFESFNAGHQSIQVVLVNQFGWTQPCIGKRLAAKMNFADLRLATDVEFGMATYEPFGISPLEPLGAGALCVISNVCGCQGFVNFATRGKGTPNVIVADFTQLDHPCTPEKLKAMSAAERTEIEEAVSPQIAKQIFDSLPTTDAQREKLIASGQALIAKMGWDQVMEEELAPMLNRLLDGKPQVQKRKKAASE